MFSNNFHDIQTWPDERLAEDVSDSDSDLWVAKEVERMRRVREKKKEEKRQRALEEARRKAEEERRKAEEALKAEEEKRHREAEAAAKKRAEQVRSERDSDKGKGIACNRCAQRDLECARGTGKSTSCTNCQDTKVKCEWAGEEPKPERRRKRRASEAENPGKKVRLEETEDAGVSCTEEPAWLKALWAISEAVEGLRTAMDIQNQTMSNQNKVLEELMFFKRREVLGLIGRDDVEEENKMMKMEDILQE